MRFDGETAVVYIRDMTGLGGGDREGLSFARALCDMGFHTHVFTSVEPAPTADRLRSAYGSDYNGVEVVLIPECDVANEVERLRARLFFNQSYMNYLPNPAPIGIYRQMFPVERLWQEYAPDKVEAINTYTMILNNSSYTKAYTDVHWDFPAGRSHVLHPPLAEDCRRRAVTFLEEPPEKERLIVSIGRITKHKNQKVMISSFLEAKQRYEGMREWKLEIYGHCQPDVASQAYLADCMEMADGSADVSIHRDVSSETLMNALARASCYLHATGAFHLPGDRPESCEHFGMSIAEAMAHGCIPIVYARGGIFDILDAAQGGIPYMTPDGLIEAFEVAAAEHARGNFHETQQAMIRAAIRVGYDPISAQLNHHIARIWK